MQEGNGLLRWVSVVLWVGGVFGHKTLFPPILAVWLLSWMSAHSHSETVQEPWMCHCTYCKDVYVGLIWLRVIYLPKDHDVTMEISGEIYLKYVAFSLSLWQSLSQRTNTGFVFTSAILLFQSQQGHNLPHTHIHTSFRRFTVWNHTHSHHLQFCFTPRENYLYSSYCWPLLSLYNSQLLSIL